MINYLTMFRLFLVKILNKLWGIPEEQRFNKLAPICAPPDRESRRMTRRAWALFRKYDQRIGPPKLAGARRLRVISNIYGIPFAIVVWMEFNGTLAAEMEVRRVARSQTQKPFLRKESLAGALSGLPDPRTLSYEALHSLPEMSRPEGGN